MIRWTVWKAMDGLALQLVAGNTGLRAIKFGEAESDGTDDGDAHPVLQAAIYQLSAYFAGSLREFDLPLEITGTDFQMRVWRLLREIPYGETRSYRDLAVALRNPLAVRAVGAANGANPLPVIIPCHRVIGANGSLVGYGGGLQLKKRLLEFERLATGSAAGLLW